MKIKSQNRERNSLDSKHIIRQTIMEPNQDMYDDQRSEIHDHNEIPEDLKLSEYFQGQANLDTGKVAGYYYYTQAKVTFENPLSTQISEDEKSLLIKEYEIIHRYHPWPTKITHSEIIKVIPHPKWQNLTLRIVKDDLTYP